MSRGKVPYSFKPVHAKTPEAWRDLPMVQELLLLKLWSMSDDGRLTSAPHNIVRDLDIKRRGDRGAAQKAVNELFKAGFLEPSECGVNVRITPLIVHSECTTPDLRILNATSTQDKPPESFNSDLTDQIEEIKDQTRETRAREAPAPKPIPVVAAGAFSLGSLLPPLALVPRHEPEQPAKRSPEIEGFLFVASLLGRSAFDVAPVGSWRSEYGYIGARPAEERQRVAKVVNSAEWCLANPSRVDARHLQKYWQKYLDGPPKPVLIKDPEAEAIRAKRAESYAAQQLAAKERDARLAAEAMSGAETKAAAAAALAMLTRKIRSAEPELQAGAAE